MRNGQPSAWSQATAVPLPHSPLRTGRTFNGGAWRGLPELGWPYDKPLLVGFYSARRTDSSTVHLVLRGSTAGSVQKAS